MLVRGTWPARLNPSWLYLNLQEGALRGIPETESPETTWRPTTYSTSSLCMTDRHYPETVDSLHTHQLLPLPTSSPTHSSLLPTEYTAAAMASALDSPNQNLDLYHTSAHPRTLHTRPTQQRVAVGGYGSHRDVEYVQEELPYDFYAQKSAEASAIRIRYAYV